MHQQSLFYYVRTEEPSSFIFQKIASGTWHTPLVHSLGDTLLSFWAVQMPNNYLAVVAVGVLTADMCEHRLTAVEAFLGSFLGTKELSPGGGCHWGHKAGEAERCWVSQEIQTWRHASCVEARGWSGWGTWNVPPPGCQWSQQWKQRWQVRQI